MWLESLREETSINMNILILAPMLASAILFIVVATQMWQRSISTTIQALCVSVAIYCYPVCAPEYTLGILVLGVLTNMIRGVINTEKDRFVKRTPYNT